MNTVADFGDAAIQRRNRESGHTLCDHCNGTGNELFAMYRACPKCDGGIAVKYGELSALGRWWAERRERVERKRRDRKYRREARWRFDWQHPRASLGMALGYGPHAEGQAQWEFVGHLRWMASHYLCIGQWFWDGKDDCCKCGAQPSDIDFLMKRVGFRRAQCIDAGECQQFAEEDAIYAATGDQTGGSK